MNELISIITPTKMPDHDYSEKLSNVKRVSARFINVNKNLSGG